MIINNTTLFKIIVVLSSLELYYFLFSFISRDVFNAVNLIFTILLSFIVLFRISFRFLFFYWFIFLFFLNVLSSANGFINLGGFFWVGTLVKFFLYGFIVFYFSSKKENFNFFEIYSFLKASILVFFVISVFLGLGLANYQVLNGRFRFQGLTYTSSILAMFSGLSVIFFIFVYRLESGHNRIKKCMWIFIIIGLFFLCYFSGSRQPFYGLVLSFVLASFWGVGKRKKTMALLFLLLLLCLNYERVFFSLSLIYFYLSSDSYLDAFNNVLDGSSYSRLRYFIYGINYIESNGKLWLGVGLNSFPDVYYKMTNFERPATHNIVLTVLMNYGVLGCFLFLFFCVYYYKKIKRNFFSLFLFFYFLFGVSFNNPGYFISFSVYFIILNFVFFDYYRKERRQ